MIWIHPAEEKEEDDGAEEVQKKPKTVDAEVCFQNTLGWNTN